MTDKCWADSLSKAELAAAFAETAAALVTRNDLHSADFHVTTLEEHIQQSANLSRVLWRAIDGVDDIDNRDKAALYELASTLADHASAAKFALFRDHALEAERAAKAAAEAEQAAPAAVADADREAQQ